MSEPYRRPAVGSAVFYQDPGAALDWLEQAFGFERSMVVTDVDGNIVHSEMRFGDGYIMVGPEWSGHAASPASLGGRNTQCVHVQLNVDVDQHCRRARAAGAEIVRDVADQFYGDRSYSARDPEGHVWSFGQTQRRVTREEAERASGLSIDGWD